MKKQLLPLFIIVLTFPLFAQFDGPVGTEGCQAIEYNNPEIKGWATGCEVFRGYQDIATMVEVASYGTPEDAIGEPDPAGMAVVSLGDSGVAILSFGLSITNGDGYDFAVFENSFSNTSLELGFVEVSSDGEHWVRFPATSNTPSEVQVGGFGIIDAIRINNFAGKHKAGWGTPFDLEELRDSTGIDVNNINYVKIIDVIGAIDPQFAQYDTHGNIVNDPYPTDFASSGFDLAGVAVLNGWRLTSIPKYNIEQISIFPNPCTEIVIIRDIAENEDIFLYNVLGGKLYENRSLGNEVRIDMQTFPAGVYLLKVGNSTNKIIKR
ncbi:MAG: T9SS type A sorting domain-containing protein [Bacteroidales bacterium]|jgi:hypothetical protein|nr:T9SS type A sorting domain-containing protein [Bacteroidales bacterium]